MSRLLRLSGQQCCYVSARACRPHVRSLLAVAGPTLAEFARSSEQSMDCRVAHSTRRACPAPTVTAAGKSSAAAVLRSLCSGLTPSLLLQKLDLITQELCSLQTSMRCDAAPHEPELPDTEALSPRGPFLPSAPLEIDLPLPVEGPETEAKTEDKTELPATAADQSA